MTQQDKQREAFEAAYKKLQEVWDESTHFIFYDEERRYQHPRVDDAWHFWQAAIAHAETRMNRAGSSDSGIDLPPLPEAEIDDAGAFMSDAQVMSIDSAKEYARVAVEHYLKRGGGPDFFTYMVNGHHRSISETEPPAESYDEGTLRALYATPQPAEPKGCQNLSMGEHACSDPSQCWEPCGELGKSTEHAKVVEPVKVPSEDERAAQGLSPYNPRHLTEEEWNRLVENGRKAWGKKPAAPEQGPVNIDDEAQYLWDDAIRCDFKGFKSRLDALLARYGHPVEPEGWQLVPKEPTEEMLAATSWPNCAGTDYKHMLAAAPNFGEEE